MTSGRSLSEEVFVVLRRINRVIDVNSRQLVSRYGLTSPQLLILKELSHSNEFSVGTLAKNVNLSNGTVTDILDRMEKRGFVQRTRSTTDKRRVYVKITDMGLGILKQTPSLLQEKFKKEFEKLEDWEKHLLLSSLQRIAGMMEMESFKPSVMMNEVPFTEDETFEIVDIQQSSTETN
ncbi:MarR family transcriptional regulator [bacterium]|nr:MarR family transcriptional regulator [bacterium]